MNPQEIDDALKAAELKKIHSEIKKIDSDYSKNELEKSEIRSRIEKKWWHVQAGGIIQAIFGGVVAGALVAGFGLDHFLKISDLNQKSRDALISEKEDVEHKLNTLTKEASELQKELAVLREKSSRIRAQEQKMKAEGELIEDIKQELALIDNKSQKVLYTEQRILELSSASLTTHSASAIPSYITDVWAYNVDEQQVSDAKAYLNNKGYEVGFGGLMETRAKWLALTSTVFYYHNDSEEIAQIIANDLAKITHLDYEVKRGAGLGVLPAERKITFFVHLVN